MYNNISRIRKYHREYSTNQLLKRGSKVPYMTFDDFVKHALMLVNRFKTDYAAYQQVRGLIEMRNMDPFEHAMIMQYNNDGYRKELIEKVGEGMQRLRDNNRVFRETKLSKHRKSNVRNEYGSFLAVLSPDELRQLLTALTGRSSVSKTATEAKRDIVRALNKMMNNK